MAQAAILEESGVRPNVGRAIAALFLVVVGFVGWAAITEIDEVSTAEGQILPSGDIRTVQHLEGGIVAKLLVREGDFVEAGRPLIELDPAMVRSDLDQMKARTAALSIRAERLLAFSEERQPVLDAWTASHPELVSENLAVLRSQQASRESGRSVLSSQIAQRKTDLLTLEAQASSLDEQAANLSEILRRRETLSQEGLVGKISILENQRELLRLKGDRARFASQIVAGRQAVRESEEKLAELTSSLRRQAMDDYATTTTELAQTREGLAKAADRVERLSVVAPITGRVQGLSVRNQGAVIQPGGILCQIVPSDEKLRAEVRILPKDVGHVREGQPARLKLATYDHARYGTIKGRLSSVSASSFQDEKNGPWFKAEIELEKEHLGANPKNLRASAGMTVQADVVTGSKTVLEYIAKPIQTQIAGALHER
jgi:HlyD family secretion protein/adhesin transport system membrane fusion protein